MNTFTSHVSHWMYQNQTCGWLNLSLLKLTTIVCCSSFNVCRLLSPHDTLLCEEILGWQTCRVIVKSVTLIHYWMITNGVRFLIKKNDSAQRCIIISNLALSCFQKGNGNTGLVPLAEADWSAQIGFPVPRSRARWRLTGWLPNRDPQTACRCTVVRYYTGSWTYRWVLI